MCEFGYVFITAFIPFNEIVLNSVQTFDIVSIRKGKLIRFVFFKRTTIRTILPSPLPSAQFGKFYTLIARFTYKKTYFIVSLALALLSYISYHTPDKIWITTYEAMLAGFGILSFKNHPAAATVCYYHCATPFITILCH